MKNVLKKILPCVLALAGVAAVASCKTKSTYPSETPVLSNPNGEYLKIDDYSIKNHTAYYRLLQSYGVATFENIMDKDILNGFALTDDEQKEFDKEMNKSIYGTNDLSTLTDDEKEEKLSAFLDQMVQSGYKTEDSDKNDDNYYLNYYRLEFKRLKKAKQVFAQYVIDYDKDVAENNKDLDEDDENWKEVYYTNAEIETQFNSNYFQDFKGVVVTFDSEKEALAVMANAGINTQKNNLVDGWKKTNGEAMTKEEVVAAFEQIYLAQYGKQITSVQDYTYGELTAISSTITSKAYALEDGKYSFAPLVYGTRYYLVYRDSVSNTYFNKSDRSLSYTALVTDKDNDVLDETVKQAMVLELEDTEVTSNYIAKVMLELRNKTGLKIFDEGLEKLYVLSYNSVYSALSITDYTEFATTNDTSKTVVLEYTVNGTKKTVTADDMFNKLIDNYGPLLSLLYIQQYVVLGNKNYNTVYNYVTDTVLDQDSYDDYYDTDVKEYKDAFNKGDYASSGYPKSYGWSNFLRDYLGVEDEKQLLINLDSTLYTDALANYKQAMWLTGTDDDTLVQTEMEAIYNAYFSATVSGVHAYFDDDLDGVADDVEENSAQATLLTEFVNYVYTLANEKVNNEYTVEGTTISERVTKVLRNYKLATTTNPVWGKYKAAQMRAEVVTNASYDSSSSADKALLDAVKANWKKIVDYTERTITGQSLDPGYRYEKNDVAYYVTSEQFQNDTAVVTSNGAYRFAVTKATAPTYISSTEKTYKPTYAEYTKYVKSTSSVSSSVASAIKAYYTVAISNLTTEALSNNKIMDDCKTLLEKVVITSNSEAVKNAILKVIATQITKD